MKSFESNKQRWRREGNVEYVSVEARPTRRDARENRATVVLDWTPADSSGACEAFQALQRACLACKTAERASAFYAALRQFADAWGEP